MTPEDRDAIAIGIARQKIAVAFPLRHDPALIQLADDIATSVASELVALSDAPIGLDAEDIAERARTHAAAWNDDAEVRFSNGDEGAFGVDEDSFIAGALWFSEQNTRGSIIDKLHELLPPHIDGEDADALLVEWTSRLPIDPPREKEGAADMIELKIDADYVAEEVLSGRPGLAMDPRDRALVRAASVEMLDEALRAVLEDGAHPFRKALDDLIASTVKGLHVIV